MCKTILNINRRIGNHSICFRLQICLSVFFHTKPEYYSPTRTLRHKFISFSIPSSQFTLPLRCLITAEDCGTQMIEKKKKTDIGKTLKVQILAQQSQPQLTFKLVHRKLSLCLTKQGPLVHLQTHAHSRTHSCTHILFLSSICFVSFLHIEVCSVFSNLSTSYVDPPLYLPLLHPLILTHKHTRLITSIVTPSRNESFNAILPASKCTRIYYTGLFTGNVRRFRTALNSWCLFEEASLLSYLVNLKKHYPHHI